MKDELVGKIMKESVAVRPEIVISRGCVEKNAKATNQGVTKQEKKF